MVQVAAYWFFVGSLVASMLWVAVVFSREP